MYYINYDTRLIDACYDYNIGYSEEEETFEDVNDTTFLEEKLEEL